MLDFYLIEDTQRKPAYPKQAGLEHVGELDEHTFDTLQKRGIIGSQFDFYADLRWDVAVLKQIRQNITDKDMQGDRDAKKLLQFIELADSKRCGLIAYGD
jgi:hypothetical protein